jgi:transposase
MAPVLAVTLSWLILELDMPKRKASVPQTAAATADPVVNALLHALRSHSTPAAEALLKLLERFDAPGVEDLVQAFAPRTDAAAEALLQTLNPRAAGIDIGTQEIYVCFPPGANLPPPPPEHSDAMPAHVRRFRTFTADLEALAELLHQAGVDTVAMESTGVYWVPLYDLLENKGFRVLLADARQTSDTPGRPKTDVKDCMWIQRLHSLGLLRAAFRPDEPIRVLRSYQRHRQSLIADASRYILRMQKALEQMNVKLTEVISDVTGVTGMAIIRAIVAGERDPQTLARLRQGGCKNDAATIALALQGTWREEHLFELRQCLEVFDYYQTRIAECDKAIDEHLETLALPDKPQALPEGKNPGRRRRGNDLRFDARRRLYEMAGVDLTAIEGIEANTAFTILSEVGTDMSRWANEKKFGAWLGLAPSPKKSGGKLLSATTRPGANRAALALRLAARTLMRSKSALGAFLRRIAARRGMPKAITATAYKLARIVYGMLKRGMAYAKQEMDDYEQQYHERQVKILKKRAKDLGFELTERSRQEENQKQAE